MNNSLFGQLNARDLVNGVIVAFLTACLTSIVTILDTGVLPDLAQLKAAGLSGLVAALAYLTKNLVTNSQGELGKTE